MKTTSFFTRVIIAFQCISANAQTPYRIANDISTASVAVIHELSKLQEEMVYQNEIITSRIRIIGEQQWDNHRNYQGVDYLKAATQAAATQALHASQLTFNPSEEQLSILYYNLGVAYYYGSEGFRKDSVESIKWFTESAKAGSFKAQVFLGRLYYKADDPRAVTYWEMAISNDKVVKEEATRRQLSQVYFFLGSIYYKGKFGITDKHRSSTYFKEAANLGNLFAKLMLLQ